MSHILLYAFRALYDQVAPPCVIARLDPKSGLPDFGIILSKSETSDFDAIQYPLVGGYWIARSSRAMTARREVNLIENALARPSHFQCPPFLKTVAELGALRNLN